LGNYGDKTRVVFHRELQKTRIYSVVYQTQMANQTKSYCIKTANIIIKNPA